MNENIINYLDEYITKNDIHFATLLKGKWGTGKTFFINNYIKKIESRDDDFKVKFIYVSLFGLKSLESVNEIIFQQFHPILGSKTAKIATNVLKGALRIGINLDLNKDGKNETLNADFSKTDFLSYFEGDKRKQAIFIFDDLERTQIPIGEILGFINGFVEHSGAKVIIICNEDELTKDNLEIYKKFKEKIINRAFDVQADMDSFWLNYTNRFNELGNEIDKIKDVYKDYGNGNLRVLSHITENYVDLLHSIEQRFKDKNEFLETLTEKYFIKSFCKRFDKNENDFKEVTEFDKIIKSLPSVNLFNNKDWDNIVEGTYNKEKINENIANLTFFKSQGEELSWVTLWNHTKRSEEKLADSLTRTQDDFNNLSYENPATLVHVINLLVYFNKNGISNLSVDEISSKVDEYIDKYRLSEQWAIASECIDYNNTGLDFYAKKDNDVRNLVKKVEKGFAEARTNLDAKAIHDNITSLKNCFKNGDIDNLRSILSEFETQSILNNLNIDEFFGDFIKSDSKLMNGIFHLLSYRYRDNYTLNGHKLTYYLADEIEFLEDFHSRFDKAISEINENSFYKLKLNFCKEYLESIIKRFKP